MNNKKAWIAPAVTAVSSAASAQSAPVGMSPDGFFQGNTPLRSITS